MKKTVLLLLAMICQSLTGFAQTSGVITTQPASVDLRLDYIPEEKQISNKAAKHLLLGFTLTSLGVGIGLVGPMFNKAPIDPTFQYLKDVQAAGSNSAELSELASQYQNDLAIYNDKVVRHKGNDETFRLVGLGTFMIGAGFNISGVINTFKSRN